MSDLESIAADIRSRLKRASEDIVYIGQRLIEARAQIPSGRWTAWVEANTGLTIRTAQRWMGVVERLGTGDNLSRLLPSVLIVLASPSVPTVAVREILARTEDGENFSLQAAEAIIDKWRGMEAVNLGAKLLLGGNEGKRSIPRSAVTSLEAVSTDALARGVVEIEGIDHPIPDVLNSEVIRGAVDSETRRRKDEHIADNATPLTRIVDRIWMPVAGIIVNDCVTFRIRGIGNRLDKGMQVRVTIEIKENEQ